MKKALVLLSCLLLSACTSGQVSKSITFDATSQSSLIFLGVHNESVHNPLLTFHAYQPESGVFTGESKSVRHAITSYFKDQRGLQSMAFELPPGHWVLTKYRVNDGFTDSVTSLQFGTVAFEAVAGQALYIGDYAYSRRGALQRTIDDQAAAHAKLNSLVNVRSKLTYATTIRVTFNCDIDRDLFGKATNCDPTSVNLP